MKRVYYTLNKVFGYSDTCGLCLPEHEFNGFSEKEKEKLFEYSRDVIVFDKQILKNIYVTQSYIEFCEECDNIIEINDNSLIKLNRRLRSYMVEFHMYIEHLQRQFSKLDLNDKYEELTHKAYDGCIEYALACILRNYITHVDDAISYISKDGFGLHVIAKKETLLKEFHSSKGKDLLIDSQPNDIDIVKIVNRSFYRLSQLQDETINYFIQENTEEELDYLVKMSRKTILINSNDWYIFSDTGKEGISINGKPLKQIANGYDFVPLQWNMYNRLKSFISNQKTNNRTTLDDPIIDDYYHIMKSKQ